MSVLDRWKQYRRTQIEALRESNHPHHDDDPEEIAFLAGERPAGEGGGEPHLNGAAAPTAEPSEDTPPPAFLPYGRAGQPLNRHSPFFLGFVGGLGVLTAVLLWNTV